MSPRPELAVIFDLDGLLADTEPVWSESARLLLERRGRTYDPRSKSLLMGRHPLEVARWTVDRYGLDDAPDALLAERLQILLALYTATPPRPLPGARELVTALQGEGVPMAVASGSPSEVVEAVLQQLDLRGPLAVVVGSDAVLHGKPAPDVFLLAAERLGVDAEACVVLEDSPAGVKAALAAGMACVAVPSPGVTDADVAGAHARSRSLSELSPAVLREIVVARGVTAAAPLLY
jgi:HAD superfamily hydrolase (TIGR01509 family)